MKTSAALPTTSSRTESHVFPKKLLLLLLVTASLLPAGGVRAAVKQWSGAGSNNNWTNTGNWTGGVAPVTGDSLVFNTAVQQNSLNGLTNLSIAGIGYDVTSNNVTGGALLLTGGINDNAGWNTNGLAMTVLTSLSISNNAGGTTNIFGSTINLGTNNTLNVYGNGFIQFSGVISGSTNSNVILNGPGNVRMNGANTWTNFQATGGLTVGSGTLILGNGAAIPAGAGRGNFFLNSGANLELNGNSQSMNTLSDGTGGGGNIDNSAGTATYTLTIGGSTNANGSFGGTIGGNTVNGSIIAVTKTGTNTQTFTSAQSYTGVTTINQGDLVLGAAGNISSSAGVTVAPFALFDYSASPFQLGSSQFLTAGRSSGFVTNLPLYDLNGSLTVNGSTMNPVAGVAGTMTINGGLTLNSALLNFDLNNVTNAGSGTNDLIVVSNALNISGLVTVQINPLTGSFAANKYTLIQAASLGSGAPANFITVAPRGISATYDTTTTPGTVYMNVSGVSAPASNTWVGVAGATSPWDVDVTADWKTNGIGTAFFDLDNATFNDTCSNSTINLPGGVSPSSMTFNNNLTNYLIAGAGSIGGAGGLTKSGNGWLSVRTQNSFSGPVVINGGIITNDFIHSGGLNNQLFYNGVPANTLTMSGNAQFWTTPVINSQTYQLFSGTIFNAGSMSVVQFTRNSGATPAIYLAGITRNQGATVDFEGSTASGGSQTGSTTGIFTTNANTASGILAGWATTTTGGEWARVNTSTGSLGGFHIYGGASYLNSFSNTNTDMTASIAAGASASTASLRFNTAAATTLTLNGNNVITSGGILVTPTVAGNTETITGGSSLTTSNGQDLIVIQNASAGSLVIASVITNSFGTPIALTKSGAGPLVLTASNAYTGPTYINAGSLQIGNGGAAGDISTSSSLVDNGTLVFDRSDGVTISGAVGGSGGVQNKLGSSLLAGDNTYSGATTITAGTLQIGNGGAAGSISNSASVADGGTLVFNRTGATTYNGPISGLGGLSVKGGVNLTLTASNSYAGNTTINPGTLTLGPAGAVSGTAAIVLGGTSTLDASAPGGVTLGSGVLAGTGVVKGTVTIGGTATVTPGTNGVAGTLTCTNDFTFNGGTLFFDVTNTPGTSDLLAVGGNVNLNSGNVTANVLGGSLALGTYKLIGYHGSLGGTAVSGTSVSIPVTLNPFQSGKVAYLTNANAGEVDLQVISYVAQNLTWAGTAGTWDEANTAAWNPGPVTFHDGDNVTFDATGIANLFVTINNTPNGAPAPGTITVNVASGNDYTLGGSGNIAGGGSLTKNNTDNLFIETTNNNIGSTLINSGTVQVGNGSSDGDLGALVGNGITNNATLIFDQAASHSVAANISGSGGLVQAGATTLSLIGNNAGFSGTTTVSNGSVLSVGAGLAAGTLGSGPVVDNGALLFNRSGSVTFSGGISGSGGISNIGPGTLVLGGVNTYATNTVIANGTLQLGATNTLPYGATNTGNVELDGGSLAGILDLNGKDAAINGLVGAAGSTLGQVINSVGPGTNFLTVGNTNYNASFIGIIRDNLGSGGSLALVKVGTNTQTLDMTSAQANLYSGGTIVSNGIVFVAGNTGTSPGANNVAFGTGPVTMYGGTIYLAGSTGNNTAANGNNGFNPGFANAVVVPAGASGTINGPQRGIFGPASVSGTGTLSYSSPFVRGEVSGNFTNFAGTLILQGEAGITAAGFAPGGGENLGLDNTLGFPNAHVVFNPTNSVLLYSRVGGTIPIGELSGGDGGTAGPSYVNCIVGANNSGGGGGVNASFAVGGLNTSTNFNGAISDGVGIIKVGTGSWTLTNSALTYSGTTTVSNGLLSFAATASLPPSTTYVLSSPGVLDISTVANPFLTLASNMTLQGNSTLRGGVNLTAGTIAPGWTNVIATLTVTNAVTNNGGTMLFKINRTNSPNSDKLTAPSIVLNAGAILTVTNIGSTNLAPGDTFTLFTTPPTGNFTTTNLPTLPCAGLSWSNTIALNGQIAVVGTPCINLTPPTLTNVLSGNSITLSWAADHIGYRLMAQTNPINVGLNPATKASFSTVPGSTLTNVMTIPINPTNGTVFYLLQYP